METYIYFYSSIINLFSWSNYLIARSFLPQVLVLPQRSLYHPRSRGTPISAHPKFLREPPEGRDFLGQSPYAMRNNSEDKYHVSGEDFLRNASITSFSHVAVERNRTRRPFCQIFEENSEIVYLFPFEVLRHKLRKVKPERTRNIQEDVPLLLINDCSFFGSFIRSHITPF